MYSRSICIVSELIIMYSCSVVSPSTVAYMTLSDTVYVPVSSYLVTAFKINTPLRLNSNVASSLFPYCHFPTRALSTPGAVYVIIVIIAIIVAIIMPATASFFVLAIDDSPVF